MTRLPIRLAVVLVCVVAIHNANAQAPLSGSSRKPGSVQLTKHNPFEKYIRVVENIYVYDRSLFVRYTGPAVPPLPTDEDSAIENRRRLGVITVAPTVKFTLEATDQPMNSNFELRDTKTGQLVHEFSYYGAGAGPLLFTGQGTVFDYAQLSPLCGVAAVTRKYEFVGQRFTEVQQPMLLLNAEAELLQNVQLHLAPDRSTSVVASLTKGTSVAVLAYNDPDRFLIRTPLGLTGWLVEGESESAISISRRQCN